MKWDALPRRSAPGRARFNPDDLAPPGWGRLREVAWHMPRLLSGLGPLGPRGPGGRAAGAGHPRLPRHRPDDDGAAPRARPGRLARPSVAARAQHAAPRPTRWTCSASGSTAIYDGRAGAGRRLEPRRDVRARAGASHPEKVRAVVTLGSPFSGDLKTNTNVREFYERIAGHDVNQPPFPRVRQAAGADAGPLVAAGRDRRAERRARAGDQRSTRRSRSTPTTWASRCTARR